MPVPVQVQVPIQVQANKFNRSISISLWTWQSFQHHHPPSASVSRTWPQDWGPVEAPPRRMRLLRPRPDAAAAPASGGGGRGGGGGISGVGVRRTFSIHLVLELALDDLRLGATAGALNLLDVLVILVSCQDCLQLRVCYLKESGFI